MSEQAAPERPATPEAPTATYPGAVEGARYDARGMFVHPVFEPASAISDSADIDTSTASPCTATPRDTGEIYPAARMVGVVEFLREAPGGYRYERSNCAILLELDRMLQSDPHSRVRHFEPTPERHLAACLYTLDGILRDARNLNLAPEAQERLRGLMVEMSRP